MSVSLKQLLQSDHLLKVPGIYDGLSAQLVQQAGFSAAFVSGACVSFSRLGKPDLGLVDLAELTLCVGQIREVVSLPLIVDMDTGVDTIFSSKFACPICSYSLQELEPRLFSFNNPMGACPKCGAGAGTADHRSAPPPVGSAAHARHVP